MAKLMAKSNINWKSNPYATLSINPIWCPHTMIARWYGEISTNEHTSKTQTRNLTRSLPTHTCATSSLILSPLSINSKILRKKRQEYTSKTEPQKPAMAVNVIPTTIKTPIFSDSPKSQLAISNQCTTSKKANEYTRHKIPPQSPKWPKNIRFHSLQ